MGNETKTKGGFPSDEEIERYASLIHARMNITPHQSTIEIGNFIRDRVSAELSRVTQERDRMREALEKIEDIAASSKYLEEAELEKLFKQVISITTKFTKEL